MDDRTGNSAPETAWHALAAPAAVRAADSDAAVGLSAAEAARRQARHGPNLLPAPPRPTLAFIFLRQFKSPLIYLLLGAGGVALALREVSDALVIFVVVLTNALIGAVQEGRAARSLEALRRLAGRRARLRRAGRELSLPAAEVVPGDLLVLAAGDAVVADARLLEAAGLLAAEASLTGESLPVAKQIGALPAETSVAERRNMLFAGTQVTAGRGVALVVATAADTELGRISALTGGAPAPVTPLEARIARFGGLVMVVAPALFLLVLAVGGARGLPLAPLLMIALSQVVGLVPEGLPVAMTIALAVGVQRMARRGALVRRLAAVETLGSTTLILSDKTGTLTRNEMTVLAVALPGRALITLPEDGPLAPGDDPDLRLLLEVGVLCNDARLASAEPDAAGAPPLGDPTEVALLALAAGAGLDVEAVRRAAPRRAEIPFDAAARLMATEQGGTAAGRVLLKGAPEVVLPLCATLRRAGRVEPLDATARSAQRGVAEDLAARALRVLALALVEDAALDTSRGVAPLAGRATWLGLVGEMDPPRPEAAAAVAACIRAGIRPVMVTGDHAATGLAVARRLGLAGPADRALTGRELEAMDDAALEARLATTPVFARVHPAQKLRLVEAFQRRGEVVAMTGDGVNDAPALARADVGVAMGRAGTEVAREAARIVLTDDNFATIVAAVEEGRVAFQNIKKVLLLLVSTSAAEVVVLLGALALGYPAPFAAVQILWNNLVTEGVIVVNLIMDPPDGDEMRRPPTPGREPLITPTMWRRVAVMTPTIALCALGWFAARLAQGVEFPRVQSETFTLLAVCEWFNVLNCRSETRSALRLNLLRNPWLLGGLLLGNLLQAAVIFLPALNRLFHTVPINPREVLVIGLVASLVLWVEEGRKVVRRLRGSGGGRRPGGPA